MSGPTESAGTRRWWALIVLCTGALMIILDGTVVTIALPTIQRDLGFTQSSLAWVVNAYLIPFGGLLLLAGRLGDLLGRTRVFLTGLVVFTLASVLCGAAHSQATLIAARFAQGIGGALASSVVLGMIIALFPDGRERATAIAVFSFTGAAGASVGTVAGGALTQLLSWHWAFFVNVPIGVVALVVATRVLTAERGLGWRAGADLPGAVLATATLMGAVYTIITITDHDLLSLHTLGFAATTVVLAVGFVARQARAATPLVGLRIFASRVVGGANLAQLLMVASFFGFQFLLALYLQRVLGFDALRAGLAFLPVAVTIGLVSLGLSARLGARFGARRVLLVALGFVTVGLVVLTRAPASDGFFSLVVPVELVMGVGGGLALPTVTGLGMSGARPADAGLASGLLNTTQQVGGAVGLAVVTTLATAHTTALRATGHPASSALLAGYHLGFGVAAGLALAAAVVTAVVLRDPATDTATSTPAPEPATRVGSAVEGGRAELCVQAGR
jgi:EmrB/QacA subfamily drug resistance transporter